MKPDDLATLRDIQAPAVAGDDGLLIAAGVVGLLLAGIAWYFWRRRQLAALRELARMERQYRRGGDVAPLARGLSVLLRKQAVARFPLAAGLTGQAWLSFLDAHGGGGEFANGPGAVLATLPYQPAGQADGSALIALARRWLKANPL